MRKDETALVVMRVVPKEDGKGMVIWVGGPPLPGVSAADELRFQAAVRVIAEVAGKSFAQYTGMLVDGVPVRSVEGPEGAVEKIKRHRRR